MPIIGFFMAMTVFGLGYILYFATIDFIAWLKTKWSKNDR